MSTMKYLYVSRQPLVVDGFVLVTAIVIHFVQLQRKPIRRVMMRLIEVAVLAVFIVGLFR